MFWFFSNNEEGGEGSTLVQMVGGFLESIARIPFRIRTAAGNSLTLEHDDTDALIGTNKGKVRIVAPDGLEAAKLVGTGSIESPIVKATTAVQSSMVESTLGPLQLRGQGGVEFPDGVTLPSGVVLPIDSILPGNLTIPTAGTTAARPVAPMLGQEYFDTDLDDWIKWMGTSWRYLTGADV